MTPDDEGDYHVDVSNDAGSVNSDVATLTVLVPPTVFNPPDDQTVLAGDEYVGFSVDADGTDSLDYPMTYFWRHNGNALLWATDYYYDIVHNPGTDHENYAVIEADAGSYCVVVSNYAGAVVSANASLRVLVPPDIAIQPKD